jgi:hypothetical protein
VVAEGPRPRNCSSGRARRRGAEADEVVSEAAPDAESATDEAAEQPSPTGRGPKPKKKSLPRSHATGTSLTRECLPSASRSPVSKLEAERGRSQQRRGLGGGDKMIVVRPDSVVAIW